MIFTRQQIESGMGFFTSGEWTCIWRIGPDRYVTCAKGDRPQAPDAYLAGGGRLHTGGKPHAGVLRELRWCD